MSVKKVLIVGGGFTGLTAAIALAREGVQITLIDRVEAWARVGHGLTIQGNALRVFQEWRPDFISCLVKRGNDFIILPNLQAIFSTSHDGW